MDVSSALTASLNEYLELLTKMSLCSNSLLSLTPSRCTHNGKHWHSASKISDQRRHSGRLLNY